MNAEASRLALLRLGRLVLVGHGVLLLVLGYWGLVRAPDLVRRGDNARWRAAEQRIARGRILDRRGRVLALTERDEDGLARRRYPVPGMAPVLGYQAWRYGAGPGDAYGSAGAEARYDAALRGDLGRGLRSALAAGVLHRPQQGHDLRLTLDADLQGAAAAALAGRDGAIVVLDVHSGAVLALASVPSFDPADLDGGAPLAEDPSHPLLNRATQGLYVPGSILKLVTLAAALEAGAVRLEDVVSDGDRSETLAGLNVACGNNPPGMVRMTIEQALGWSCNLTFGRLGIALGSEAWRAKAIAFGLSESPPFPLDRAAASLGPEPGPHGAELVASAFGQGPVLVTPLHMALMTAAIAADGILPKPYLLEDVPGVSWRSIADERGAWRRAVTPAVAGDLRRAMGWAAAEGWARPAGEAAGSAIGGKTGTAQLDGRVEPHAWFVGFAPLASPRVAVAVLVAHGGEGAKVAAPIGGRVLAEALKALAAAP